MGGVAGFLLPSPRDSRKRCQPHRRQASVQTLTTPHRPQQKPLPMIMGEGALSRPLSGTTGQAFGAPLGNIGEFVSTPEIIDKFSTLSAMRRARREGDLTFRHEVFRCRTGAIPGKELSIDRYEGERMARVTTPIEICVGVPRLWFARSAGLRFGICEGRSCRRLGKK